VCLLLFTDINPSSWREGDALIRRVLGPPRHVKPSHSPPTRDKLSHDSHSVDNASKPVAVSSTPSLTQDSRTVTGEFERSTANAAAVADSPVEQPSDITDEVTSESSIDVVDTSSQHQSLPADANNCDVLNIQEPAIHSVSIRRSGNSLVDCSVTHCRMADLVSMWGGCWRRSACQQVNSFSSVRVKIRIRVGASVRVVILVGVRVRFALGPS